MSRQTLIIIVIILVFGGAGLLVFLFSVLSRNRRNPDRGTGRFSSNPDVQRIEQELTDLRRLKDLQLDTSILKNPFLQSLEAPRTPQNIISTTPGRSNPFLPF